MKYYTNVISRKNELLVRYIEDGRRYMTTVRYKPRLYIPSDEPTGWTDIYGNSLQEIQFRSMYNAKDYCKENVGSVFGNESFQYPYIQEEFHDVPDDFSDIRIYSIDIETESENGFAYPENPTERINLITIKDRKTQRRWTFGLHPFDVSQTQYIEHPELLTYHHCPTERDLLSTFLGVWKKKAPDVVTGWNIKFYDIPYLVGRIQRILGDESVAELSPWEMVYPKPVTVNGMENLAFVVAGVTTLDYLDLYKKFVQERQESYKLDYIAEVELGRKKLENPHPTFREFYTLDWAKFVEYNVVDVDLVDELDKKKKLIPLIMTMAYDAKSNYDDVFSPVRMWDCIIFQHLMEQGIVPPIVDYDARMDVKIVGAFVMVPTPGMYYWTTSFDAASLYPSIMMQYNMSPETITDETVPCSIDGFIEQTAEMHPVYATAANGFTYRRDVEGQFTQLVKRFFRERVEYKNKMLDAQKQYELTPTTEWANKVDEYHNRQQARKIQLNSLYGAQANKYFRFYDVRIAEGITMTGQAIIRRVAKDVDALLNTVCDTPQHEYVKYIDTDSIYISLNPLIEKGILTAGPSLVDDIIHYADTVIQPQLSTTCADIAEYSGAYENQIRFKREIVADRGIWAQAKKRYVLSVIDSEGVRYTTPKIKPVGFETNRSNTPKISREALKHAMRLCLTASEKDLWAFIDTFRQEFYAQPVNTIACPTSVNNLLKYTDPVTIYKKRTPIHVRAALLYNKWVADSESREYVLIREADKIKYILLQEPNPWGENVIAAPGEFPPQMHIQKYADYEKMFEKTFLNPIQKVLTVIQWNPEEIATLNDLFL
jgi:DNA polymerase elongation subunit (family B)